MTTAITTQPTLPADAVELSDGPVTRRSMLRAAGLGLTALVLTGCKGKGQQAAKGSGKWTPLSKEELEGPARRGTVGATGRGGQQFPVGGGEVGRPGNVIPRSAWTTARPATAFINPMRTIDRITIHHAGFGISARNQSEVARILEAMRRDHTTNRRDASGRPWADIGYHYLIDPAGRIWEGRDIRYQGAHVRNNNERNLGIQVMGNFNDQRPTSEQLASLDAFVADRARAYGIPVNQIYTHQELGQTECPGASLQAYMEQTRSSRGRMFNAIT